MALTPGTRLGVYEVTTQIGAGGMGEVYRATDGNLKRSVAIKVLPASVAGDADRLARFQREAEVLASLNHPHIAQIYGFEEVTDQGRATRALVMELVEGPTLEERIGRGPVPIDEARSLAVQMVEALACAHQHKIIHRDFKPANVKITADGRVKVLDFGLAKALDPETSAARRAVDSPTLSSPAMTRAGTVLGTAAYMAPEQARGIGADKRADIWAFGVVLYEMLTGRPLFGGDTFSDTLANVLTRDVDFSALPNGTPASMRRLLRHCLARDRKDRLQDIGDARFELADVSVTGESTFEREPAAAPRGVAWRTASVAFVVGIALALAGSALWWRDARQADTAPLGSALTFHITPQDGVALDDPPVFAVSPDGQHILLRGLEGDSSFVFVRSLASGQVRRLDTTRGVSSRGLLWAPDNRALAFVRDGALFGVGIDGSGLERVYTERMGISTWSTSGVLFSASPDEIKLLDMLTRTATTVIKRPGDMPGLAWPFLIPPGRRFLASDGFSAGNVFVGAVNDPGSLRRLVPGVQPAVVPGFLLALADARLLAYPFDAERAEVVGAAVTVRENVRPGGVPVTVFSASQTGVLAFREQPGAGSTRLVWFDRRGVESSALQLDRHCRNPELSPDGSRVAVECYDDTLNTRDLWIYDLARETATRLTADPADDGDPLWSPDSRRVLFGSSRGIRGGVFEKAANGMTPETLVFEGGRPTSAWSPDGRQVAVLGGEDIAMLELQGERRLTSGVGGSAVETELQWSPDGRFISYSSDASGREEIFVQPWPPTGERWQISINGGTDARWNPAANEILFLSPTRDLMAASIDRTAGFRAGSPVRLFRTSIAGPLGIGHRFPFAISRDGQRLLMYVTNERVPPAITVIVNWPALVQQR